MNSRYICQYILLLAVKLSMFFAVVSANTAYAEQSAKCASVLRSLAPYQNPFSLVDSAKLGFNPIVTKSIDYGNNVLEVQVRLPEKVAAENPDLVDGVVGSFAYGLSESGEVLQVDAVTVSKKYQGAGLYEAMFRQVLNEYPQIKVIKASLVTDNQIAIRQNIANGMDLNTALQNSPAYKIRARAGFTKVLEFKETSNYGYILTVGR